MVAAREQVEGDRQLEPEAGLRQKRRVTGHRHRVARDQPDNGGPESFDGGDPWSSEARARWIGDHHIGRGGVR